MQALNATFKETKKAVAFEGVIITSDRAFFEKHGYIPGEPLPYELQKFFADSYLFLLREIGYHGTDKNILSAAVHLDETTPHLQLYYLPVVDEGRRKVYAKGADGKVLRNEKGSPVQAKDEPCNSLYYLTHLEQPKIFSSDFCSQRCAQSSFANLPDEYQEPVTRYYGLERGEAGSSKKHTTKYQWQKRQQEREMAEQTEALKKIQSRAELAEGRQANAEREAETPESERKRLTRGGAPPSAAAEE